MESSSQPSWGYLFVANRRCHPSEIPSLASQSQREKFQEAGLVVWDHETQTITHLSGNYLLGLYEEMKGPDDWRHNGIIIGTPVTQIMIDYPDEPPQDVLTDKIHLVGQPAEEICCLLHDKLDIIRRIAAAEQKHINEIKDEVIRLLISWSKETPDSHKPTES